MTCSTNNQNITILAYEKINDKYSKAKYGDFDVIMDMTNGYINATKLCTDGGKKMCAWLRNDNSKELIKYFGEENKNKGSTGLSIEPLYTNMAGSYNLRGTYVHPDLLLPIATWISPIVFLKVNKILNLWRSQNQENEIRFYQDIGDALKEGLCLFNNKDTESVIRDKIALEEDGKIEVETPFGFIDVLTDTKIIEVKSEHLWKHALGQLLSYGHYYPNHQKCIYLFNSTKDIDIKDLINTFCLSHNVTIKYI